MSRPILQHDTEPTVDTEKTVEDATPPLVAHEGTPSASPSNDTDPGGPEFDTEPQPKRPRGNPRGRVRMVAERAETDGDAAARFHAEARLPPKAVTIDTPHEAVIPPLQLTTEPLARPVKAARVETTVHVPRERTLPPLLVRFAVPLAAVLVVGLVIVTAWRRGSSANDTPSTQPSAAVSAATVPSQPTTFTTPSIATSTPPTLATVSSTLATATTSSPSVAQPSSVHIEPKRLPPPATATTSRPSVTSGTAPNHAGDPPPREGVDRSLRP